jgi:lipoyl-dependent peroxiredoxin
MTEPIYTVEALSTGGGRDGHVRTIDGVVDFDMRAPRSLGGPGTGYNPEQLFAAGYAACFHSAILGAARMQKLDVTGSSVGARIGLTPDGAGGVDLSVHLEVVIPGRTLAEAEEVARIAHAACPYSKAVRGNIEVTVDVVDE